MTAIYIMLAISICIGAAGVIIALVSRNHASGVSAQDKQDIVTSITNNLNFISAAINQMQQTNNVALTGSIKTLQDGLANNHKSLEDRILKLISQLDERMQSMSKMQEERLENIRQSNERHIKSLQEDNNKQLDKMRETVDEKLSKTISERFEQSFKILEGQLENVHKSLGEMQSIAADVGSLSKVLSNVKTTGIVGEVQLGAILEQLLSPEQYQTNVVTGEGREPVEYAIKYPGADDEFVYLPIDSKFPYTVYTDLQTAYDKGDSEQIKQKSAQLKNTIISMAKDINKKYICPPKTTDFAVMFLPIEGLYAEVLKMGLLSDLQTKYKVTIAGPTTMSAFLNSLQMGFRTLAIQKKSSEVWKILGAVRTEFDTFNALLEKVKTKIDSASKDVDALMGTRSKQIERKLRSVERLDAAESTALLGLEDNKPTDADK